MKTGHMIEIKVIIGTIRILEVGTTLEMTGIQVNMIKVIEETLSIETGHVTKVEVEIKIIEEDLVGIEETVYLGMEVNPPPGIKVNREGVITVENQDIL